MEMLRPRDGEGVPSSTRPYESNAKLLGDLPWVALPAVVAGFVLVGGQLRTPRPGRAVPLLDVVAVVLVVSLAWPPSYRLLRGRRR